MLQRLLSLLLGVCYLFAAFATAALPSTPVPRVPSEAGFGGYYINPTREYGPLYESGTAAPGSDLFPVKINTSAALEEAVLTSNLRRLQTPIGKDPKTGEEIYYAHVVDIFTAQWGGLLRRLEEAGVLEDTIVLWYADHGRDRPRNRHVTRNSYEKGQRMHAMNPVLAMLLPPSFSLGQSGGDATSAYLDSIGRRHIGEEQRELYKNILDNSWKEMRVTPFDTHAMMMDLVHGSTDGIKKVRQDSPTVVTFGRSLAANQTELAAKKAAESGADFDQTLEETLRPPCHVMGVVDPDCRYTESRDVTVDAFGDGSRNDVLAVKVRELLSQHTRIRDKDAYGNFSALPHCTLCVDYLTVPLENFNFTQMSLRSFEGTNRGLFVYNVALTVPHFNRSIGDRDLIWEGETGSFHSSDVDQPPESSRERQRMVQDLLDSATMLGIQRHSKYKPDQVFCGAKAWAKERFYDDHMHWCARAPPK